MAADASTLPRIRRRRRPPKLAIAIAIALCYALSLAWVALSAAGLLDRQPVFLLPTALWTWCTVKWHRAYIQLRGAIENDRPIPRMPVAGLIGAWAWITLNVVALILVGLLILPRGIAP
jgi:hypothetical protein